MIVGQAALARPDGAVAAARAAKVALSGSEEWNGFSVLHTFNRAGRYPVTLVVRDSHGGVGSSAIDVYVVEASDACSTPDAIPPAGPFRRSA